MKPTSKIIPHGSRSFREISRDFLQSEAPWHHFVELLCFGAIAAVSAWPLLSLAGAVASSIK
jgi:hypothetical protein